MGLARAVLAVTACIAAACGDDGDSGAGQGSSGTSGQGSSGDSSASSSEGQTGGAAQICVDSINAYRKQLGLAPYERWTAAEPCADGEAQSDASTGKPHGAFGKCGEAVQNECPGWPGPADKMIPQCLKAMWGEGPGGGHHDVMASTTFKKVACGFGTASNGALWAMQDYR